MNVQARLIASRYSWTPIVQSIPSTVLLSNLVLLLKRRKIREKDEIEIGGSSGSEPDGRTECRNHKHSYWLTSRPTVRIRLDTSRTGIWTSLSQHAHLTPSPLVAR